ncbi:DUF2243 domain-containing protein [Streptosporangium minutum]|uniref:DUF2243 domain-containing protein n=1 Tax=Streptosporangium minutum TaxID=569862 RepID=A0A243QLM7_9ACTN|nr:DUF2243 domain-containing protein [Streptosporangium minutum]OUC82923.1 hypothetical protein CA984_41010 [Streptosporangium minutum]
MTESHRHDASAADRRAGVSPRSAGLVLGFGVGGFIDGIVLHQLMGWHHMLSGWYPNDERVNMIGDGLFHLGCLIVVVAGVLMLSRVRPVPIAEIIGWMIAGWGAFNLLEGLIDHQILGVHHVRHGPGELLYDLGFLLSGVVLIALGTFMARVSGARRGYGHEFSKGERHE